MNVFAPHEVGAAGILRARREGRLDEASQALAQLIREEFGFEPYDISFGTDGYSLNSVNGFVTRDDGAVFFFKFHHEEGEESVLEEFYRGEILQDAGYPVDMPAYVCRRIGRQILLYDRRTTPRLADAARAVDLGRSLAGGDHDSLISAQDELDRLSVRIYRETWHPIDAAESAAEPIHQLFYHRLAAPADADGHVSLGGRAAAFFADERLFALSGATLTGAQVKALHWVIDGTRYEGTLGGILERSLALLSPASLAQYGGVIAHGDAHNANVWFTAAKNATPSSLTFFDPAFAGRNIPALLAEVKATFHNILAHADWLYHPADLAEAPALRLKGGVAHVTTNWSLTPLRRAFLRGKARLLWRPLLADLRARGALPSEWRETLRCALFCCPTLVMDLRVPPPEIAATEQPARHTPASSLLGLSIAMMCGAPALGDDLVSQFLTAIDPETAAPSFESI